MFELIDDLVKFNKFAQNHIAKDQNPFLTQINQADMDKQDANFDTKLEIRNQILSRGKEGNLHYH